VVTITVSVVALLLLARLRFPQTAVPAAPSPAAPALERLAARATFDELAGIITDLQRRVSPTMVVLPLRRDDPLLDVPIDATEIGVRPPRAAIAVRIEPSIAIAPFWPGTRIEPIRGGDNVSVIAIDELRQLLVLQVPAGAAAVPPSGAEPFPAPSYLAAAESGRTGVALRPLFVSRADPVADSRWDGRRLGLGPLAIQPGAFVFSLPGELLGMVHDAPDGASLITTRMLIEHAARLQREGSVRRGTLGFSVQPLTPALARATGTTTGVVVAYVAAAGPAAAALRVGDIVETVDGEPVTEVAALAVRLNAVAAGGSISFGVIRRATRFQVQLTASADPPRPPARDTLGLTLQFVRDVGAEVVVVEPGTAAATAGLQSGDLITEVNGARPRQLSDISRAWAAPDKLPVLLGVRRAGRPLVVALERLDAAPR
jgi:hypothetical protein